jgi:DNA-binding XRE family transcriptional regulator
MTPAALIEWRKDRSLTQEALGTLLGVSRKAVNEWENERAAIPPYLWLALKALEADQRAM